MSDPASMTPEEAQIAEAEAPTEAAAEAPAAAADVPAAEAGKASLLTRVATAVRETTTSLSQAATAVAASAREKAEAATAVVRDSTARRHSDRESGDGSGPLPTDVEEKAMLAKEGPTQATRVTSTIMEAAAGFSRRTREGGQAAYQAAITSIRRLTAPTRRVAAVCKADLRTKPVPQVLLLTCNLVASRGLSSSGLFQDPTDPAVVAQVEALAARLEDRLLLLPADLDPCVAAAVIKHFLRSLEEPLLTYRLVDRCVGAGRALASGESEALIHDLLAELPLVNWSTLSLLMETCYRVASQWNVTGKNALSLATSLAPVLLWHESTPAAPPAAAAAAAVSASQSMVTGALQALRSRLMQGGAAATGEASPNSGSVGGAGAEGGAAAAGGELSPTKLAAEAAKPHIVLDEQEEAELGAEPALETPVVQHGAGATTSPEAAAAGAGATQPGAGPEGGAHRGRAPLTGESLDAVVTLVEHLILNYDDLFLVSA